MDDHSDPLDLGIAGTSARREHERRRASRERRTREKHPLIGGALVALRDAPAHERVWTTGAEGEEATAKMLAARCSQAIVLHDRRVPGRRSNIDHIAVARSGVIVIDSKHYKGKRVRVANPIFGSPRLLIGGSDKTKLVDMLAAQVELVRAQLSSLAFPVSVDGAFCFVGADLPLLGTPTIAGLPVLGLKGLAKRVNQDGPLQASDVHAVAARLAALLKPA